MMEIKSNYFIIFARIMKLWNSYWAGIAKSTPQNVHSVWG
jgi:hypothetical protein